MGNKLGRRRPVVDEKYTKPQGLYQHRDVDHKKLRKLILDSKLAPCYPGDDDCGCDLEECPICFLYYPSLNRSRCCMKGICTECFLQMKTPNSSRPTQCPFCKTSNYAVEYRGVKTKEEKGLEQLEEQRVIEAKIRMRQKELLDEEERMLKRREISSSGTARGKTDVGYCSTTVSPAVEIEETVESHEQDVSSTVRPSPRQRLNREDGFDLDLEDIMVMEAIWLSIQENDRAQEPHVAFSEEETSFIPTVTPVAGSSFSSPSAGLACAIAALAERQQMSQETSNNNHTAADNTPRCSRYSSQTEHESVSYFHPESPHIISADDGPLALTANAGDWMVPGSQLSTEVGSSYGGPNDFDVATSPAALPQRPVGGSIIPESFEEQMMLAMAVSLAEARARSNTPGVAWH